MIVINFRMLDKLHKLILKKYTQVIFMCYLFPISLIEKYPHILGEETKTQGI